MTDELSPIIIYYQNMTGSRVYCSALEERFHKTGHTRPLEFRMWDCYKDLPESDGDLYTYDGIVMRALEYNDYLKKLPDDLSYGDMFPWVEEKSRIRHKTYGIPFMLCSNTLYCRKEDDQNIRNVMDLHEPVAIPLKSMIMYYFIQAAINNNSPHLAMKVMEHLVKLIGGREHLEKTGQADYDGLRRFNNEECRYFLGFSESMNDFKEGDYAGCFVDFTYRKRGREEPKQYFLVDYVSIGKYVPEEKLQDCYDLIGIITSEQYFRDICTKDGKLQCFLAADREIFRKLAAENQAYAYFYDMIETGKNEVLHYSRNYYESFSLNQDILLQFLWEKTGWKF